MAHLLWRIEGESAAPNIAGWQQGLTLHLLFQAVTTIVVRRDGAIRHYLALESCPHCRPDGCDRVCPRMLFAQLVHTTLPGVGLIPAIRLAPRAAERRLVVALPRRADARLLDSAFLSQWQEGRLVTTWSRLEAKPQPIRVGALLVVSADGPDPAPALHAAGWRVDRLASLISGRSMQRAVPPPVRAQARASEALLARLREPHSLWGPQPSPVSEVAHA
jgi:hypothetical protein